MFDKRALVGFADQVFVGVVVAETGREGLETSDPDIEVPQRQLRVDVSRVLKGEVAEGGGQPAFPGEGGAPASGGGEGSAGEVEQEPGRLAT